MAINSLPAVKPKAVRAPSCAGDLIFVRPSQDDRIGQLVAHMTDGPFCHVRVRISAYEVIEALPTGITRNRLTTLPDPADMAMTGARLQVDRAAHALTFLVAQVNDGYGFLDIAADVLKALLPRWLGSRSPFLVSPRQMDCSHLAAVYLLLAGYKWLPDDLVLDVARCSPNSLARALGVIK